MEWGFHAAEEFYQLSEPWVTTGIPTAAYGDPFQLAALPLQVCQRLIGDGLQILKAAVLFTYTAGAVIASFPERQAVPASQWLNAPNFFKITIFAKSTAVDPGAPSNIHGELCHLYTLVGSCPYKVFGNEHRFAIERKSLSEKLPISLFFIEPRIIFLLRRSERNRRKSNRAPPFLLSNV
jgi:hypothetical protein